MSKRSIGSIIVLAVLCVSSLSAPRPLAANTIMVYVQRFGDDSLYHIALEDGVMSSLFASGHIALNVQPQDALLNLQGLQHNIWLRSVAADIGADHVLFVTYRLTVSAGTGALGAEYTFLDIARPGSITSGQMSSAPFIDIVNHADRQKNSYLLGKKIVREVLAIWD